MIEITAENAEFLQSPQVVTPPKRYRRPLLIKSLVCVCGGAAVIEAKLMVTSLRAWNKRIPLLLFTRDDQVDELKDSVKDFDHITVEGVSESMIADAVASLSDVVINHGQYWSLGWIAMKMPAVERALELFGEGVLLVDADIIFTGKIPNLEWDADLVLSRHSHPGIASPDLWCGIFNAGMILFRDKFVVEEWHKLFVKGVGDFYEQGCLTTLARTVVTGEFPADWNWGGWRDESVRITKRRPLTYHIHLAEQSPPQGFYSGEIAALAEGVLSDIRRSSGAPDKIAFIHHSKAGGTSLMALLNEAGARGGWQCHGSPSDDRDWLPNELELFAEEGETRWSSHRRIVHNHRANWPSEVVKRWKSEGWVFIAVYRDLRERLCSLYSWNMENAEHKKVHGPAGDAESLDEFISLMLTDPRYFDEIAPHPDYELIDEWSDMGGMVELVMRVTGIPVEDIKENASDHLSWDEEVAQGNISQKTQQALAKHKVTKAWDKIAKQITPDPVYKDELAGGWLGGPGFCGPSTLQGAVDRPYFFKALAFFEEAWGKPPRVLEVGCGDLLWLDVIPPYNYTGMDLHPRESWKEVSPRRATLFQANAVNVPFPLCDIVVARQVFIHLSTDHILTIIEKSRKAGAKFLFASSVKGADNYNRQSKDESGYTLCGYVVDLEKPPFNLELFSDERNILTIFKL
jgi:hypothetical protein